MNRKRVCFVVESGTDVRLVEGLAEDAILTVFGRAIPGGRVINHPPARSVRLIEGPSSRLRFAIRVFAFLTRNRSKFDAVLVQGYGLAAFAANLASRLTRIRTIMLVCSPIELYYLCRKEIHQAGMPFRTFQLLVLRCLARINARIGRRYVVLSKHLSDVVRTHGTRLSIDVVPVYGIDTNLFKPAQNEKLTIRQALGLPETHTLVFFSSRIAPEKDAKTLLDAIARVAKKGRDLSILHLSGGHKEFEHAARQFGIADRVIARDAVHPVNELAAYYQASDICVQASREEGLGFSPLEAMACEVPVIASAVGGLIETVRDGETGWTYPVGNAKYLADAIENVLSDYSEGIGRARRGREMVLESYDAETVFSRMHQLLEQEWT